MPDTTTAEELDIDVSSYSLDLGGLQHASTDRAGGFALHGPWRPGHGLDRVVGDQFTPVVLVRAQNMAVHVFPLSNRDGADRDLGDLVLGVRGGTLTARLVDVTGAPVEGSTARI